MLVVAACAPSAGPAGTGAAAPSTGAAPAAGSSSAPQSGAPPAAGAASASFSPALTEIIEGARRETTLKALWSSSSFGGAAGLNELLAGVNKRYGTNIQGQFTPGPNMQGVLERLAQEQAAGQPASSDVYLGNSQAMLDASRNGALQSLDWAAILERPLPQEPGFDPIAPDGSGVAFGTTLVGIAYNTNLVKGDDIPRRLEDVLHPKWKGRIASTPYAAGMREFAMPDMFGREWAVDFTRRLSQHIGGLIRCGEWERITSGEFAMLVMTCGGNDLMELQQRGAPIGHTLVEDGTILHVRYGGVPKNSTSPNAAALLITYLHTPEGQALLWKLDGMDLHVYPEANTKPMVDAVRTAGGKIGVNSPQWLASIPNFPEQQQDLERILREGSR